MNKPAKITGTQTVEEVIDENAKRAANLRIWTALGKTDPSATKKITGKRFGGTAVKPMWINKRLTEHFGPCGIGWGMAKPDFTTIHGQDGQVLVYCTAEVWYVEPGTKATATSIGVGGDFVIKKESAGFFCDDEAYKKAYTDALNNAWKFIGVAADIHMGLFDDNKYVAQVAAEFHPPEKPDPKPTAKEKETDFSPTALRGAIKTIIHNINGCATVQDLDELLDTADAKDAIEQCQRRFPAWWETGEGCPAEFTPLKQLIEQTRRGLKELEQENA